MSNKRNNRMRGFTLIEILIVVVILGILAAIIIPQFTNAAQDAGTQSARSQLQTMRSQIELYRIQNAGLVPADAGEADRGPRDASSRRNRRCRGHPLHTAGRHAKSRGWNSAKRRQPRRRIRR